MNVTYSEGFAGIGAWGKALKRVTGRHNDKCELSHYWEFDKYASNAFSFIHEESEKKNLWDITEPKKIPTVDIFFYSPPCQTFSISGKREGTTVDKGNLFYAAMQHIEKTKPKYAIMENVKGLPSGDTFKDFRDMLWCLESLGYQNYWKVLNTLDYGIPQNRERVFVISIRSDLYADGKRFEFPKPFKLEKKLKDIVEPVVSSKYLLSEKMMKCLLREGTEFNGRLNPRTGNDVAVTLTTRFDGRSTDNFLYVISNNKKGYELAYPGDSVNFEQLSSTTRRGRVGKGVSQTITTSMNIAYYNGYALRGLTVKEGFRLQGFDDEDYFKAIEGYNQAFTKGKWSTQMKIRVGNTITVNVIEEILENLLYDRQQDGQQISMF